MMQECAKYQIACRWLSIHCNKSWPHVTELSFFNVAAISKVGAVTQSVSTLHPPDLESCTA